MNRKSKVILATAGVLAVAVMVCVSLIIGNKSESKQKKLLSQVFEYRLQAVKTPNPQKGGPYLIFGNQKWRILSQNQPDELLLFGDENPEKYGEEFWKNQFSALEQAAVIPESIPPADGMDEPAYRLNGENVLFMRDASGRDSKDVSTELEEIESFGVPSGEWSLLLSSSEQHVEARGDSTDGKSCRISYRDATVGEGNYLSAVLIDWGWTKIRAYGRIADTSEKGEGEVEVRLPHAMDEELLVVFSEKYLSNRETGYVSEPVIVAIGKGTTRYTDSRGKLTAVSNKLISETYDPYLKWTETDFENATHEEQMKCATAALLYEAILEGERQPGQLSEKTIAGAENYIESNGDMMLKTIKIGFIQKNDDAETLMDLMNRVSGLNFQDSQNADFEVNMGTYEAYLDCTGEDYLAADQEERTKMLIAFTLYAAQLRDRVALSDDDIGRLERNYRSPDENVRASMSLFESLIQSEPHMSLRQLIEG